MSSCVRCGKNVPGGGSGARCKACLAKLRKRKLDPHRHEHFDKLASDARRRESGTGKSSKKTKGVGTTKEIVKKMKEGYKKYGTSTTLSPDRIDNSKGYSASNVRVAPKTLNRGVHKIDPKKLADWKKKVKKSNIDLDDLQKSCIQKAYDLGQSEVAIALEIRSNFISRLLK